MRSSTASSRCGRPRISIVPLSGAMMFSIMRIVVVLPAPFGPSSPYTDPVGTTSERARKMTELGRTPDVLMLVDDEVVAGLMPTYLDWYVRFATNRLVVAYTSRSNHASTITADNWWQILSRPDVTVGRADPSVAPA